MGHGQLGLAAPIRVPRAPHVAPTHRLCVPLLACQLHAALDQVPPLLELPHVDEQSPLEYVAEGVRAPDGDPGPHGDVAIRQLDGAIEDRHALAVLADLEEGVNTARGGHIERRVPGLLGQGDRLPTELRGRAHVPVVDGPDARVDREQNRPGTYVPRLGGHSLRFREHGLGVLVRDAEAPAVLQREDPRREAERRRLGRLR